MEHPIFWQKICSTVSRGNICAGDGERLSFREIAPGTWLSRFPWWLHGKEFTCQCKRCRFDPWVRKIPWRRKWQPTPVFLPGKFHGQRSLVGYNPWGCKESDTTVEADQQHGSHHSHRAAGREREQRGSGLESMV